VRPSTDRALALLSDWGVTPRGLRCVANSDCEVWRFTPAGAAGGGDLSLRIYAEERQDADAIDVEMLWLRDLANQGLHVPAPVALPGGGHRATSLASGSQPPRHAVLLQWLPGRMLFDSLRPLHLHRVGVLTAHLHASAARLHVQGLLRSDRPVHSPDLDAWAEGRRRLPAWAGPRLAAVVPRAARRFRDELVLWPRDAAHRGWIHGDLHPWNLLFQGGQAGAIDFSDGGWGFLSQDLASALQFLRHPLPRFRDHRLMYPAFREALFDGYATVRALPPALCVQADTMVALRQLHTLQWMSDDWRSPDERPWGRGFVDTLPDVLEPMCA
jgi:Ser/Thr protein kinase RdoA (MazF antagonist)